MANIHEKVLNLISHKRNAILIYNKAPYHTHEGG